MKKLLIFLFAFSGLLISSCSKDNGPSTRTCDVSTDPYSTTQDGSVTYSVIGSGTVSVSTIKYQDVSGVTTKTNPTLPFSISVSLPNGTPISVEAIGTTQSGTITVAYNVLYPDGSATDSSACGN